jgi:hypothetical protein
LAEREDGQGRVLDRVAELHHVNVEGVPGGRFGEPFLGPLVRTLSLPPALVTQALRASSTRGWGPRTDAPP